MNEETEENCMRYNKEYYPTVEEILNKQIYVGHYEGNEGNEEDIEFSNYLTEVISRVNVEITDDSSHSINCDSDNEGVYLFLMED